MPSGSSAPDVVSRAKKKILTTQPVLPTPAPTILTECLILRPLVAADLPAYHVIRSDPEVMRFNLGHVPDPDEAFTAMKLNPFLEPRNRQDGIETYIFGIEERCNPGVLLGDMGCSIAEPGREEIGYMLSRACWEKGYATEGLKAFLMHWWGEIERKEIVREVEDEVEDKAEGDRHWAMFEGERLDYRREVLRALAEVDNIGSRRVLEKCGFLKMKEFEIHGDKLIEFELRRPT